MIGLDLARLLPDAPAGEVADAGSYRRAVGALPEGLKNFKGFGLDADENAVSIGV